jgi:hypothetical protein
MNKFNVATPQDLDVIGRIANFAWNLLWRNGHVLLDTGDGALLNFVTDDTLGDDDVLTWCHASVSLCFDHKVNFQSRISVLESLGLSAVSQDMDMLTYEGQLIVEGLNEYFKDLILAGYEAGETNLKSIEINSVNHDSELFQIETFKFLPDEEKGGD